MSDNGAATYTGIATNAPLKGGKFMNFEGGVNVPFVVRWPKHVPAGGAYGEPVSTLDAFMTIARAARVELPSDRPYDGVDLVPHLTGEDPSAPHEALFWRAAGHRAVRAGRYKWISDRATGAHVLYDVEHDPYEQHDLTAEQSGLARDLERKLLDWEAQLIPPRWPQVMEYRFSDDGRDYEFPL